jgi:hypothetical protein
VAGYGMGHYAHALLGIAFLQRYFIMKLKRAHFNGLHLRNGEIQYHGLFHPIVYLPVAVLSGLCNAQPAFVKRFHYRMYGILCFLLL